MSKRSRLITSASPGQTAALARHIGRHIPPGAVIAAYGELGTGKTCFAAGLARGMGIGETIVSPTYGATDTERILEFIYDPKEQRWLDEAFSY